jgi:hypothetical protein
MEDTSKMELLGFTNKQAVRLGDVLVSSYLPGITYDDNGHENFVLQGEPWSRNSSEGLHALSMLVFFLEKCVQLGITFVASADVSSKYFDDPGPPMDIHSWFLSYNRKSHS